MWLRGCSKFKKKFKRQPLNIVKSGLMQGVELEPQTDWVFEWPAAAAATAAGWWWCGHTPQAVM